MTRRLSRCGYVCEYRAVAASWIVNSIEVFRASLSLMGLETMLCALERIYVGTTARALHTAATHELRIAVRERERWKERESTMELYRRRDVGDDRSPGALMSLCSLHGSSTQRALHLPPSRRLFFAPVPCTFSTPLSLLRFSCTFFFLHNDASIFPLFLKLIVAQQSRAGVFF